MRDFNDLDEYQKIRTLRVIVQQKREHIQLIAMQIKRDGFTTERIDGKTWLLDKSDVSESLVANTEPTP